MARYIGRFAPSPTGPLHAGSLVAALASWLDARAHGGRWLVRIEDTDMPRCVPGADEEILRQLARCGLVADETPLWQSQRGERYQAALDRLQRDGWVYPCGCSRKDIDNALAAHGIAHRPHAERVYPGTCRNGLHGKRARAWRMRSNPHPGSDEALSIAWHDRRLGAQQQDLTHEVGDFVLKRADGLWAYQLAVVVDDAEQGITDVVRGEDLADNTPRQIHLQRALALPTPRYLHTPLVLADDGQKLSKQTGALALALDDPLRELKRAAAVLALPDIHTVTVGDWLAAATRAWGERWVA
ncbi:MAG TPA: tRNA glutamyl-Q(34) synthetase GluQRS [Burkholderiaceae bacterium]|jgi:glutamyl-Q tRNA(Asp) synthetase|nr:tRNA glutamyl-Q(34) synthetase GluQRS [Burkholderiaceae bacterium]